MNPQSNKPSSFFESPLPNQSIVATPRLPWWTRLRAYLWPPIGGHHRKIVVIITGSLVIVALFGGLFLLFHTPVQPTKNTTAAQTYTKNSTPEKQGTTPSTQAPSTPPADNKTPAPTNGTGGGSSNPGTAPSTGSTGGSSGGGSQPGGGSSGGGGGSPTCPVYPSFPTTSCTGWQHTGVSLAAVHGTYYATTPGEVLDSKDFIDGVVVEANNVTIKRSRVEGKSSGPGAGIWVNQGVSGTLIEDVEVTSQPGFDPNNENTIVDRAITGFKTSGLTMRRVYAHKMIRGLQYGCNTLIEDSYVDDEINPTGAHMSAIGGETCASFTLTVRHNNIGLTPNVNDSAALLFYPPQVGAYGTQNLNVTYEKNLIYGGTYCMWLSSDPQFVGAVSVINNQFDTKYYSNCGLYGTHFKDNWGSEGSASMNWSNNTLNGQAIGF